MKHTVRVFTALILSASVHTGMAADIVGTIKLKGTAPAETPIPLDPACGKLHDKPMTTTHFVVGPGGELANTVVYLKSVSGKSAGASAVPIVIDQSGCQYSPHISAAQTGQKILVKNSDTFLHNVHPTPTAPGNKEENKAQMPKGADLTFSYNTPEQFLRFKCDVHPWMFAYVTVVDHPYIAVSGKDGKFKISNVPAGKYTISAAHRKAAPGGVDKEIEVKGDSVTADFTLELK